jgi:hypothetical protein
MIGDGVVDRVLVALLFAPLAVPALLLILGLLCGLIRPAGMWRDSFATAHFSPTRLYQFIATVVAAAGVVITLAQPETIAFPSIPGWLVLAAGGGNGVYLIAKLAASRRAAAGRPTAATGG